MLRHMYLMHTTDESKSRRLEGRFVEMPVSVPLAEADLTEAHETGELVTVFVFASIVPFVFNGMARYSILRRATPLARAGRELNAWQWPWRGRRWSGATTRTTGCCHAGETVWEGYCPPLRPA
jgi:hypothetical protein